MRTRRVLAVLAVLALVGVACRGTSGPSTRGDVETGVGVTADGTIVLGELSPLTESVAVIGIPLTKGHEVYFDYVNEELGGVGRNLPEEERFKVELRTLDTKYVPDIHLQQYKALKDDVLLIAQSLGTPTTKAILADVNRDKILTGAATLASAWLREKYVIPAGAPYPVQVINAFEYVVNVLGVADPKVGIIYQDDDYGEEGVLGLEFAAEQFGFDIVARATYKTGDTSFGTQVGAMQKAGATHVFLTTTPSATGGIVGTGAAIGYTPQWIGQSPSWIGLLAQNPDLAPALANLWVVTDASCPWGDTSAGCEGMAEMVANLEKYGEGQEPDYYFQFGYTQARIVHQILERAVEIGKLTREGVVEAFEGLSNADMGGLLNPISYGPECEDKIPATGSTIYSIDTAEPIALKAEATVDSPTIADFPFCD